MKEQAKAWTLNGFICIIKVVGGSEDRGQSGFVFSYAVAAPAGARHVSFFAWGRTLRWAWHGCAEIGEE